MNRRINILHLEDSYKDSELIKSIIENGGIEFDYFLADNETDYVNVLANENVDLIIADYSLPDYDGYEAFKVSKELYPDIPFIFVSGTIGEDTAVNAMVNGAVDYVLKNNLARLVPAIKRSLRQAENELKRKQAEEELMESRKNLHEAYKLAHIGVWDWKADEDKVTWTEELYKIAGLDTKLPAPTYAEHQAIYTPQSWQLLKIAVEKAMNTGKPYQLELELLRPDGKIRNVNAFGGRKVNNKGQITGLFGTVQDITERTRAEKALRESETFNSTLIEHLPQRIFLKDLKSEYIICNNNYAVDLGIKPGEIKGKNDFDFYPADFAEAYRAIDQEVMNKGEIKDFEEKIIRHGEAGWIHIIKIPYRDAGDHITGVLGVYEDISKRKKAEQELITVNNELVFQIEDKEKQAKELVLARKKAEESDNLKSAFLHNLSHEIRTPMNQILGFASFLKDPDLTEQERDDYITTINNQSFQLLHIITNIIEISEITTGQVELKLSIFNLRELMEDLFASFKPKAEYRNLQLRLSKKMADADAIIRGDQVKLKHVFNHLIENAIKYTDAGNVDIEYFRTGNSLIIAVRDTGIGLQEQEKQLIFEHFRQVDLRIGKKYGGMGLGLAISNAYVWMMGGRIRVESKLGEGSTFFVEIPDMPAIHAFTPIVKGLHVHDISRPDWKGKTLLIAEDEKSNADFLKVALRATGIHLLFATNGLEAVEQCKKHPEITIVLMDIKMPRMDGLEATKILKSLRGDLPIIATTAFARTDEREFFLQSGCDDYLPKPIRKEELIATIQKYMA